MEKTHFELQRHVDDLYRNSTRKSAFQAKTAAEVAVWRDELRGKIRECLGIDGRVLADAPQAEHIETLDRGDYREEKWALDVGEGVLAPMYLLIPKTPPPYKAILTFPGHGVGIQPILGNYPDEQTAQINMARDENYAQALAQAGYLVCAVEQRGFGERVSDQVTAEGHPTSCRHLSFEYLLEGRTLLGERCRDGMVALTYLLKRNDVIKESLGCCGHSGGGTTALWLSALDERIATCVVSCYFCSFKHSILAMQHCECNYVPGILEYAEMGDLGALIAPRPFRAINGEHDPIYPIEGTRQQFPTVQHVYDLLGAGECCSLAVHPGEHRFDHALSLEWFERWLCICDERE